MPQYCFFNPETGEYIEIVQKMNDEHVYIDENGLKWNRIFTVPNAGVDTVKLDPFSKRDFLKKTQKAGTVGELMDRSKEMAEARKGKEGFDPIQQQYFKEYSKARGGKPHPEQIKQVASKIDIKI